MPMPVHARGAARGHPRADRRQRPARRATSARSSSAATARWASTRSTARSRCRSPLWPWGAYLGEEGKQAAIRAKVSSWRRISRDSLIPHAKAVGPVPQQRAGQDRVGQGRLRGGDPARRPRLRVRGLGREHLRRARRADRHPAADGRRSSTASTASRSSRSPAIWATRWSSATSPGPSSTWPTRCSCRARRPSWSRSARSTTTRSATGEPGPVTRELQRVFEDALHGRDDATGSGWTCVEGAAQVRA